MYTNSEDSSVRINSVSAVEGTFKRAPTQDSPDISVRMVYSNKETGTTYGTCKMASGLMGARSKELFIEFIQSIENDFGERVFLDGALEGESTTAAENTTAELSFPKGLGG